MSSRLSTAVIDDGDTQEWIDFVRSSPDASIYSTPEYLDTLCTATGDSFRILAVRRGGQIVGGVPLYEHRSAGGRFLSPRLLLYYNGLVLKRYDTRYPSERTARSVKAMTALAEWLEQAEYGRITLKCRSTVRDVRPFLVRGWSGTPSYTYVVPLGDLQQLWKRVEHNLRRLIGRCAEMGVQLYEDDDFDSFFKLHESTMSRKGQGLYLPEGAFRRYFERLHGLGLAALFHARRKDGLSIASQLVLLGDFPVAHTVAAAADEEHQRTGANPFLRWHAFESLCAKGYSGNDLTDAALNPVTHFKSQLGGNLEMCFELEGKQSRRYRWWGQGSRAYRRSRRFAGSVARRVLRRWGS